MTIPTIARLVVAFALGIASAAAGQTPGTVTLHVAAVDRMADGTTVITLASGAAIVVKHTDITTAPPPDVPHRPEEDSLSGRRPLLPTNDELIAAQRRQADAQQRAAILPLPGRAAPGASPTIQNRCATEWPADFRMRAYCEGQQKEALANLNRRVQAGFFNSPDGRVIIATCTREWDSDYRMVEHCVEQQVKGLAQLGR